MEFVDKLDTMYKTHLIYRTIVVCDGDICEYKRLLEKKDFSVYVADADADINYTALDCRVILVESRRFEEFLNTMITNKITNFYTFITFTNDDDAVKDAIAKKYATNRDILDSII